MPTIAEILRDVFHQIGIDRPPFDILFLMVVSVAVTYLSAGLMLMLNNPREMEKMNKEIEMHSKNKSKVLADQDPRAWIRVIYHEPRIQAIQRNMQMKQLVPMILQSVAFIAIFGLLRSTMGTLDFIADPQRGNVLAILPFVVPPSTPLIGNWFSISSFDPDVYVAGFGTIYVLTATITNTILTRIFGVNPRASMMPQNPLRT